MTEGNALMHNHQSFVYILTNKYNRVLYTGVTGYRMRLLRTLRERSQ